MKKKLKITHLLTHIRHRHRSFKQNSHSVLYNTVMVILGLIGLGLTVFILALMILLPQLPDVTDAKSLIAAESSIVADREGNTLYRIYGEENRKPVTFDEISPYVVDAVLAIEDDQFYDHGGIDIGGILTAVCGELGVCNTARGGSTITQQFVKNAFLSPERSYTRKAKEILLALKLEGKFEKDEILEMYLNRINYGSSIYGVELAANVFFDKSAADLTIAESAILASIPKAPTYYFPYGSHVYSRIDLTEPDILENDIYTEADIVELDANLITRGLLGKTYTYGEEVDEEGNVVEEGRKIYIQGRADLVLERMVRLEMITEEEMEAAIGEIKVLEFNEYRESIVAPHFVMYVREQVEEQYGKEQLEKGGLIITTTLDPKLQEAAEAAVDEHAETNENRYGASNASLVSIDPETGEILAMVGSRDFWNDEIDGKVNVALRPRLPGSSFKPIAYAAAFLQGYAPSTVVYDVKTKFGAWYEPENFDGEFRGPVSFRKALAWSMNVPAVKAGYLAGIPNVLDLARKMGLQLNQPDDWYGLSLALGAGEARLMDMVGAYSVFANGGYRTEPVSILKIEDKDGNLLEEFEGPEKRTLILDPQVAYLINDVLSDVNARPEGWWRDRLSIPGQINAAKTGTSNKEKNDVIKPFDTWTIGYTRSLVAGVWAGNANGDTLFPKASGLDTAGGIWRAFMIAATEDKEAEKFERPEGIKFVQVSKRSGKLPSENTPEDDIVTEVFASFSVPREYDDSYQFVEIDKVSGKLATEYTPPEARENKAFYDHQSVLPENKNWQEAVLKWAEENGQDEEIPTEYDDVHLPENMQTKPSVVITQPSTMATVSPPIVGVLVDINSKSGVSKVDYYWDDELVDTAEVPPFKGTIRISPANNRDGSEHTIKAVVFDSLYRSSASTTTVKIGDDETPPRVNFVYPGNNKSVELGTSIPVQVEAFDPNGDVSKVDFYLSGEKVATVEAPPYIYQLVVPDEVGNFVVEAFAYDFAGNQQNAELTINAVAPGQNSDPTLSTIVEPRKNQSFDEGEKIFIQIALDKDAQAGLDELLLYRKKQGERQEVIERIEGPGASSSYIFIWDSALAGTYELQLKTVLEDGTVRFSNKVPIVVR